MYLMSMKKQKAGYVTCLLVEVYKGLLRDGTYLSVPYGPDNILVRRASMQEGLFFGGCLCMTKSAQHMVC